MPGAEPPPLSSGSPGSFSLVSAAPCPASCQPVAPSRNIPRWLDGSLNPAYRPPGLVVAAVTFKPAFPNPPKRSFRAPSPTLIPPLPAPKLRARSLPVLAPPGPAALAVPPCSKPAAYIRKLTAPLPCTYRASGAAPAPSIMCAFEAARDKLIARWLLFVNLLASVSGLFVEASASSDPDFFISRVVATHAPSTLQRYLDMWSAWCLHCEIRRSSAHDPQPGVLPDWLRARSSPQGLATMPFKALSWFSRKAGLPLLRRQLDGAIARAFLSPSNPLEHRESLPFSLSFTAWLEGRVLCPETLPAETYMLGVLLCAIWASLRWGDLLWVPPARLHFQAPSAALVGICVRTKTTKSGMPWGIYSPGLLGSATSSWTTRWLSVVKQVLADTKALHPHRVLDFLPAILSADAAHPVIVKPLFRDQAVPWIRSLLYHHWNLHSSEPMPAAFNLIAAHSAKTTLLSWARQLDMPAEPRRIQGHHRLSGSDKSVALYSRDDIGPMLCCQRTVISCIRAGFRPLQPLARGSDNPLPDFPTELPSATGLPRVRWSAATVASPPTQSAGEGDDHTGPHSGTALGVAGGDAGDTGRLGEGDAGRFPKAAAEAVSETGLTSRSWVASESSRCAHTECTGSASRIWKGWPERGCAGRDAGASGGGCSCDIEAPTDGRECGTTGGGMQLAWGGSEGGCTGGREAPTDKSGGTGGTTDGTGCVNKEASGADTRVSAGGGNTGAGEADSCSSMAMMVSWQERP